MHVKLMFLIKCEELIRNGRRSAQPGRTPGLTRLVALFPWIRINIGFIQGSHYNMSIYQHSLLIF